ncbi:MAG: ABC transporter ATP-binding protein, partial [bacterium]|nr:ABC transporter ATP-binding protein [bacterium]
MGLMGRFVRNYIRPFWARMLLVMAMAAVTSSYTLILGLVSKITVDNVLQLKPEVGQVQQSGGGAFRFPGEERTRRDPMSVIPGLGQENAPTPPKTKTEKIQWLWFIFFSYLLIRFVFSGINGYYSYCMQYVGQRIVYRIRLDLHQKIQELQMTFFDRQQTGQIMSRVMDDVQLLQSEVTTTFVETIRHVIRVVVGIVVLLVLNVKLGLLACLTLPFYVVAYKLFQKPISEAFSRYREIYAVTYGSLEEKIRGIRLLLSFARERREFRLFFGNLASLFRLAMRSMMLRYGMSASCSTVSAVGTAVLFYLGALEVRAGTMSVGDLIFFNMSLTYLFEPLVSLANVNATIQQMMVVISRVFEVLDEEILIKDRPDAVALDQIRGRVVFRNVSFRYHEAGDYVLKGLSFQVRPGTSVAVVGPSGSGKSTLVNLLMRLYEPSEGTILLDDYDLRDIKISSLRKHISMVPQEPVLFSGTMADNITYGRSNATPEEIMQAAKRAELHDFLMTLPEKYEARVEERGSNLSGGQKQRLAFSMALLSDPSILI